VSLSRSLLLEQLESSLLSNIASLAELLECLLASSVLLLAHNAALASLHEVLAGEAAGRVLGSAMPDLCLCANRGHLSTFHVLASDVVSRHSILRA